MSDRLRGVIERITYHNEETGYTVAQVIPEDKPYPVTAVGNMLGLNIGESVEMLGAWMAHPQYGRQFKADNVRTVLPATIAGLEKYLGSGLIRGVGPVTAKRIVRKFGLETLRIIEEEPRRLHEVLGVGARRVGLITRAWEEQRQIKEVMLFLQGHNVSTGLAVKIYKAYGDDAIAVVQTDPYRLARDVYGIGFITADRIARELGIDAAAPERVAAGVAYVLSQAADEGNVYLPAGALVAKAAELLGVGPELVEAGIAALAVDQQVLVEAVSPQPSPHEGRGERTGPASAAEGRSERAGPGSASAPAAAGAAGAAAAEQVAVSEERAVYLAPFYYGEIGVANRLRRLMSAPEDRLAAFRRFDWPAAFAALQAQTRLALTPRQQEAVQAALTCRVAVLTGGPGTGKTITTRAVIRLAEAAGKRTALASPTGRAAKRLSEATGRPAKTIHRLLEFQPGQGTTFQRTEAHPLEADMVIVDEASMLDLLLTNHLLKAIPPGAHLLLVGDIDQLPSVGAGNVLGDIIAAIEGSSLAHAGGAGNVLGDIIAAIAAPDLTSGPPGGADGGGADDGGAAAAPARVIRLDTIFRQPEGSYIISNAHRINQGRMPALDNRGAKDFFLFKEDDPARAADLVVELVQERIPRRFGLAPADIQVLSPMHRGAAGVAELNLRLQEGLNPARPGLIEHRAGGRVFRPGDRVMQIRNNYDKDVFNGDLGRVAAIDPEEQVLRVRLDDRDLEYDFLELDELTHAFAISIHKSQGSEFPAVVVPILGSHYVMLQRNLLYTAVTRARQLVVLVGSTRAIAIAVRTDRAEERFSGLAARLRRGIGADPAAR